VSDTTSDSTGIDVPVCAKCGAPIELYGGTGPSLMTSDAHVVGLTALLSGEIDGHRCEHCGTMLPLWPTLIVRFVEANVLEMVQGSQFAAAGEAAKAAGVEIHVWATVPQLRTAVLGRMAPAIRTAGEILSFGREMGRMLEYVDERWRELTPEVFTAGLMAITGRIPGVEVRYADGADARESESFGAEMLAAAQARVWLRLALDWSEQQPPFTQTLEQDLGRYVSLDADLRTAATWLTRFLEVFPDTLSPRDRYLLEALRAYVCYAAKTANEFADRWAELFVAYDLQAGNGEDAQALRFSDGLARATVTRTSVVRIVAAMLPYADKDVIEALDAVCHRLGEETLVEDVFFDSFRADADTEELPAVFRRVVPAGSDVLFAARRYARVFARRGELDGFEQLLAEVRPKYLDGTDERRAAFEAWAGRFYKELHAPDAFLAMVGDRARDWEFGLDTRLRAALWTERSNALRQQKRSAEALAIAEQAQALLSRDDPDYRVLGTNVAILRRECGRPDEAARLLEDLLRDAPDTQRLSILESLVATLIVLGHHSAALKRAEELAELAMRRGDDRMAVWASASRVQSLILLGRVAEAPAVLNGVSVEPAHDPALALMVVACRIGLVWNAEEYATTEIVTTIAADLEKLIADAARRGSELELDARDLRAMLFEGAGDPRAAEFWTAARARRQERTGRSSAYEEAWLACHAYQAGDVARGRVHLAALSVTIAELTGGVVDVAAAADSSLPMARPLDEILDVVMSERDPAVEDARIVADLRRDVVARAAAHRDEAQPLVDTDRLAAIGHALGDVAVVEWIDSPTGPRPMLTILDGTGDVTSRWLPPMPEIDLDAMPDRLLTRLQEWRTDLPGDPLDVADWRACRDRLTDSLAEHVGGEVHLVIVEHERLRGLPWHAALGERWETSYISSWWALGEIARQPARPRPTSAGMLLAPRYQEPPPAGPALGSAADAMSAAAAARGLPLTAARDQRADPPALRRVLAEVDLAAVLCHGYLDPDGDVGLVLAERGLLAPLGRIQPGQQWHLVSARRIQALPRTSAVVLVGACAAGRLRYAGVGESLGIYAALRSGGTRTVIAPRWNIVAGSVLPIVVDLFDALAGGAAAGAALRAVCTSAGDRRPAWHAWSLALEGDWR
jgi:hypothetical protein